MYGQPTQIVAPSGASFEQRTHHLMRQQEMERARQAAHVNRLGLMSAAMFLVGAYLKKPLLGAVAGGAYFWMNHPEGGKKTSGRRTEGPGSAAWEQMTPEQRFAWHRAKQDQKVAAAKAAGTYVAPVGQAIDPGPTWDPSEFDASSLPWAKTDSTTQCPPGFYRSQRKGIYTCVKGQAPAQSLSPWDVFE